MKLVQKLHVIIVFFLILVVPLALLMLPLFYGDWSLYFPSKEQMIVWHPGKNATDLVSGILIGVIGTGLGVYIVSYGIKGLKDKRIDMNFLGVFAPQLAGNFVYEKGEATGPSLWCILIGTIFIFLSSIGWYKLLVTYL
ncbi:hypothetical protein HY991_02820 [Candidatus Micrarchaeota archaeon]|nr:hypothetical protein [Candidatus Micrarchaeota archaeon]